MFAEILLYIIAGTAAGVVVGLLPGIHPNTVFAVLIPAILAAGAAGSYPLMAFIVSVSITNTIVNFIPSIFIGAPEADTSLSVLPGHRMLLRGDGYGALFMTVCGSACSAILTVAALPLLLLAIPVIYASMNPVGHSYIHILLIAVVSILLYSERGWMKKAHAAFMFLVSGLAGAALLSSLPEQTVLFPALSGLFGIPVLMFGMKGKARMPRQKTGRRVKVPAARGAVTGWIAGLLVGLLPGIGSAQAGVLSGTALRGKEKDFMVALGGISTANMLFTLIALHSISKTRSGAAAAIQELGGMAGTADLLFVVAVSLFSCFIACLITLWIGRRSASVLAGADYRKVNLSVFMLVLALIAVVCGPVGLLIAALATAVGASCAVLRVRRMYLMGFLMLPTILYFSGLLPAFVSLAVP